LIQQKDATIISHDLPSIRAIPLQMNQLFHNLVHNALKFSRERIKPVIEIKCRVLTPEEICMNQDLEKELPYIEIVVSDNGLGFNQRFSEEIFGLFKRLNDKGKLPGSGIGLALCRKVVRNHRGEIIARSNENQGASFYVMLPLI
jgi:two-component system CheB/CheR fusion protein